MSTEGIPVSNANPFRGISDAKDILLKERKRLESALKHYDMVIAAMEAHEQGSRGNLDNLPPIRKDEFRGKSAAEALDPYLRARGGVRIPLSRIVLDLMEGGADPGIVKPGQEPRKRIDHSLRIACSNGNKKDLLDFEPKGVSAQGKEIVRKGTPSDEVFVWLSENAKQPKGRKRTK